MYCAKIGEIYIHDHGKIILFDNPQQAQGFVQSFFEYSLNRAAQENFSLIGQIMASQSMVVIEEYKSVGAQTIEYKDLKK